VSSRGFYLELEVAAGAIGEALADLTPEQVTKILSITDEHAQDWALILKIHEWVIPRHREWAQERVDEEMKTTGHCVTSPYYSDIQAHSSPHKKCVLR